MKPFSLCVLALTLLSACGKRPAEAPPPEAPPPAAVAAEVRPAAAPVVPANPAPAADQSVRQSYMQAALSVLEGSYGTDCKDVLTPVEPITIARTGLVKAGNVQHQFLDAGFTFDLARYLTPDARKQVSLVLASAVRDWYLVINGPSETIQFNYPPGVVNCSVPAGDGSLWNKRLFPAVAALLRTGAANVTCPPGPGRQAPRLEIGTDSVTVNGHAFAVSGGQLEKLSLEKDGKLTYQVIYDGTNQTLSISLDSKGHASDVVASDASGKVTYCTN